MKKKLSLILFITLLSITLLLFIPSQTALVFYKENTDQLAAFLPIKAGESFEIIFTHSIHLTDVIEKYHIGSDFTIIQDEIIYEHFGIGMPSNAEGDAVFEYKDGKYHISNLNQVFQTMNIRNGKTVSEHRLLWGDEMEGTKHIAWFNDYFEPGAWFQVEVKKLTLWQHLKGVKIDDRQQ